MRLRAGERAANSGEPLARAAAAAADYEDDRLIYEGCGEMSLDPPRLHIGSFLARPRTPLTVAEVGPGTSKIRPD